MKGIISADWHLRLDKPRCRKDDDWIEAQLNSIRQIVRITNEKNTDLYIVGDVYNSPHVSDSLITMTINELAKLEKNVYFIPGNHDLPYHSKENMNNSSIGILQSLVSRFKFRNPTKEYIPEDMMFLHVQVYASPKDIPPKVNAFTAAELLSAHPGVKWIFTGDMHKSFHYEKKGRHVVNPGCINRQSTDEKDYETGVYFVDTSKEKVEFISLVDDAKLVDDEYIKEEKEREGRIEAFVSKIKTDKKMSLSFVDNVKKAMVFNKKNLRSGTVKEILSLLEEVGYED